MVEYQTADVTGDKQSADTANILKKMVYED